MQAATTISAQATTTVSEQAAPATTPAQEQAATSISSQVTPATTPAQGQATTPISSPAAPAKTPAQGQAATTAQILTRPRPVLGCVLMASGMGRRFGSNKLLADFRGQPMILRILTATDTDLFAKRILVTRHPAVARLCEGKNVKPVVHDLPGKNDTVRLGLESLEAALPQADGCIFCPCDQPLLTKKTLERMARAFAEDPAWREGHSTTAIFRLAYKGIPGSPVLFPKKYFPELKNLPADRGGAYVANAHREAVQLVEAQNALELKDADTEEALKALALCVDDK